MSTLSTSHDAVLALLDSGKQKEARQEYARNFAPTIKQMYGQVSKTYPARFAKIGDWCTWANTLVAVSSKTERVLASSDSVESANSMSSVREHFYKLHKETATQSVSDVIYAFRTAARAARPAAANLRSLRAQLDKAPPSAKSKANPSAFTTARDQWAGVVDPILQDGSADEGELEKLRTTTETFYRAFGTQFE